ncbi:exodeoxyribonuclease VII small subunit [Nitrincola tibetensis]|jgi:exodeoxyribonuclease VII small subunit|uniref:Exodeoxyribonuclease 7 small subunit n=1 Tax=Nitrincola tibetensis TaxID=2219697 RepID=A0A364NJY6_9GAMM|nr:exodeoxyribonuclease VII small subunit [Nitrincola tibetensis]RAU17386.1 exodeoxyribonuclease VII small subunit [Nitrincola tibetensis]
MTTESNPISFEQSITRLEALVEKMEQGDLPIEEALKTFEEGISLTRECQMQLEKAEQRVNVLIEENGEAVAYPFKDEAQ